MRKKILCFLLSALFISTSMLSCEKKSDDTNGDVEKKEYVYDIDETKFNVILPDGTSNFNIVRKENASGAVLDACMTLKNRILEDTGVELEIKSDFEKEGHPEFQRQDYEILIGHTNREESDIADKELNKAKDFAILQSGTRIAILAKDDSNVGLAVDYFIENYIDPEKCSVSLDNGESKVIAFDYPIDKFTINGIDASEYAVCYSNDEFKEYADAVKDFIYDNYGYSVQTAKDVNSADHKIIFNADQTEYVTEGNELAVLESRLLAENGNIVLLSGILVDAKQDAEKFVNTYFNPEEVSENIEYTIESSSLINESKYIKVDDKEFLSEIDQKAAERRDYIKNTPNGYTNPGENFTGKIYYFSNDGSDSNDGLSEETPFSSIEKLNILKLNPGDIVLFNRGDEFRGKIKLSDGVTYSSYGEGEKPIINGSKRNFADPGLWNETDVENVYKCSYSLENVGNIVFNYSGEIGNYEETIGQLQVVGVNEFESYKDLDEDLEFASDLNSNELYLYCENGNPGDRFDSIEICEGGNIFQGSNKDVTVDNLTIIFGGSHGVGSGTVENRTVQNCIFAWIGGSILKGYNGANVTRYGNAVEVYGGCNGYYVYDNWIYQIYDTGITHQFSTNDQIIKMENIEYRGNIVELCHWSIEYYNRGKEPGSLLANVHVHDNMTLYGCYGWGSVGRESGGALHNSFQIVDDVTNYVVENNIFAYSKGNIVRYNEGGDRKIIFKNNTYVQYYDRSLGYMFGKNEKFDGGAVSLLVDVMKEENPVIVFLMHDEEREAEEAAKKAAEEAAALETSNTDAT